MGGGGGGGGFRDTRGSNSYDQYSGALVKVNKPDAAVDQLAQKINGESRVKFQNDPIGREFDAVSDKYIAQTKPAIQTIGKDLRV